MSVIEMNRSSAIAGPASLLSRMVRTLFNLHNQRRTLQVLDRLSDQQLDDIGLSRSDIERIARGH